MTNENNRNTIDDVDGPMWTLPPIGTRFIRTWTIRDPYTYMETIERWEGVVVRIYDAWAGTPCIEVRREDTGELMKMSMGYWSMARHGIWGSDGENIEVVGVTDV
jgi:hypothetical protein